MTNLASGAISGTTYGVFVAGGGTVHDAGTISGGTYAVDFVGSANDRVVVDPGAVFNGAVVGGTGANTLELTAGASAGTLGGMGSGSFTNFQALSVDTGAAWTLTGSNSVANVANNGALTVAGSLSSTGAVDPASTGVFKLAAGATFEIASAIGSLSSIDFVGRSQLVVDAVGQFGTLIGTAAYSGPTLLDFGANSSIDLKNFASTGAGLNFDQAHGLLQLTNAAGQAATLAFNTATLGSGFHLANDGASGLLLTHS